MKNQGIRYGEQGGAIVWILIMIVLLAALTFAATRNSRTGLNNLDKEKLDLAVSEILGYANALRDGARSLKVKGCDVTAISFEHQRFGTAYNNTKAPSDGVCHMFRSTGASLSPMEIQAPWLDVSGNSASHYGQWLFTGDTHVMGVGSEGNAGSGCVGGGDGCQELIAGIPYISRSLCEALNRKLKFGGPNGEAPRDNGSSFASSTNTLFIGAYSAAGNEMGTATPSNYPGKLAGCIEGGSDPVTGTYHFYQVLLAR